MWGWTINREFRRTRKSLNSLVGQPELLSFLALIRPRGGVQRVQNWMTRGIPPKEKIARPDLFLLDLSVRTQGTISGVHPSSIFSSDSDTKQSPDDPPPTRGNLMKFSPSQPQLYEVKKRS